MSSNAVLSLDIDVLENYNPLMLSVADVSTYPAGTTPANPFLEITIPGFSGIIVAFIPSQINVFNSKTLGLTAAGITPAPLPDGLWTLKYSVKPNYKTFVEKSFMRLNRVKEMFDTAFLKTELSHCDSGWLQKQKRKLDEAQIFIQAAMAAAGKCDNKLAIEFYFEAKRILEKMDCIN